MTYEYVKPTEEQEMVMDSFRIDFQTLHERIVTLVPEGRGKSLALTKLQEAAMWLNKGITNNA